MATTLESLELRPRADRFVGRAAELRSLARMLASGHRLVTLTGPPGVGKTRLARELMAGGHLDPDRWSRVGFVVLVEARSEEDLLEGVARGFDLALGASVSRDGLGATLAECGRLLLIADNLEQIVGTARDVFASWLDRAPGLQILATSRERLLVHSEQLVELGPLSLPTEEATVADMADSEAVQLFVSRGAAVRRGFELEAHNAPAVARLVRLLDGIPLSIELAASRLNLLSAAQILERLTDRFGLLRERAQSGHHRGLEGAIAWSWDQLTADERSALAQCAVFRGGFALEAAEAVIAPVQSPTEVLELLQSLRDKSLLQLDTASNRLSLLRSIADFAASREEGLDAARRRHARYFGELGEACRKQLAGPRGPEAWARLRCERDNLRAAVERCGRGLVGAGDALFAFVALAEVLLEDGPYDLVEVLASKTLPAVEREAIDPLLVARAHLAVGDAARLQTRPAEAEAAFQRVEVVLRECPSTRLETELDLQRATAALDGGDAGRAAELLDRGLALAESAGDLRLRGWARMLRGFALVRGGRYDDAIGELDRSLADLESVGAVLDRSYLAIPLGDMLLRRGDPEAAAQLIRRIETDTGPAVQRRVATELSFIGARAAIELRRQVEAARFLGQALREIEGLGAFRPIAFARLLSAELALDGSDLQAAEELLRIVSADLHRLPTNLAATYHQTASRLAWHRGDRAAASASADEAVSAARRSQQPGLRLLVAERAALAAEADDLERARELVALADRQAALEGGFRGALAERLYRAQLDAAELRSPGGAGSDARARRSRSRLVEALREALRSREDAPPWREVSHLVDQAVRPLIRALPENERRELWIEATDPTDEALLVGAGGAWFRPPGGSVVELGKKRLMAALLDTLTEARESDSANPVSHETLIERLWPGERILPEAASNRVYYTVSTLRKLGLGALLQREKAGYRLDSRTRVVRFDG